MPTNRLREIRKERRPKLTLQRLAELVHQHGGVRVSHQQLSRLEKGERKMTFDWAKIIAPALNVEPEDLMVAQRRTIPIIGYIGNWAEVTMIEKQPGQGQEVPCPRGIDPQTGAALVVRSFMIGHYIPEGWLLFYNQPKDDIPPESYGKLCVVKRRIDGRVMLRRVRPGYREGLFNLVSADAALSEDVALEWAAPVRAYLSPEMAFADVTATPEPE